MKKTKYTGVKKFTHHTAKLVFSVKDIFPYPHGYFLLQSSDVPLSESTYIYIPLSESTYIITISNYFYKI